MEKRDREAKSEREIRKEGRKSSGMRYSTSMEKRDREAESEREISEIRKEGRKSSGMRYSTTREKRDREAKSEREIRKEGRKSSGMRYSTSMEKRYREAESEREIRKEGRKSSGMRYSTTREKRDREADPKKNKKRDLEAREREADPKKRNKKREREADPKKWQQEEDEENPKTSIIIHCSNSRRRRTSAAWQDIPHHLLELFLKPLETVERPNMSRVCKAWGEFKPQSYSCFPEIVLGDLSHLIRGFDYNKYNVCSVLGSSDGWLIMIIRKQKKQKQQKQQKQQRCCLLKEEEEEEGDDLNEQFFCLLNLVTKDTIQLPILLNYCPNYPKIVFSSSPTDPDCIAMMFDSSIRGFLFTKRGCNKWFESQCEYPFYSYPRATRDCLFNAIVLGGGGGGGGGCTKFYALSLRGILVAIDIDVSDLHHPTTTLTVVPVNSISPTSPIADGECFRRGLDWFLVESLGKLLVARLFRREIDKGLKYVDVLELDFDTMSWSTLKSLPGDQVLFLGLYSYFSISGSKIGISSSSSSSSSSGGGGNCIYVYDDFLCKINKYDMHSQEVTVCRDFPKSELLDNYRRFWVRPSSV